MTSAVESLGSTQISARDRKSSLWVSRYRDLILALALAMLAIITFWPATRGSFVYDDTQYITDNPAMQGGRHRAQYQRRHHGGLIQALKLAS